MKLSVKLFSQADSRWANVKLGTSTVATLKTDGCLLTDVCMVLNYFGKETDPSKLNIDLKKVNGFYNGALLIYKAVSDIYPDIQIDWDNFIDCGAIPAPLDKIDAILASRRPVIVKVDYDYKTAKVDQHWVTIIGKAEDGAYIIADPIDGSEQFFHARYGDPQRFIFKIVVYSGPMVNGKTDADRINDLEDKVKSLNEQVANLSLENNTLRTELSTQEEDNKDLAEQLNSARSERDKANWETDQLQLKVTQLTEELDKAKKAVEDKDLQIKTLKTDLIEARGATVRGLGSLELLVFLLKKLFKR